MATEVSGPAVSGPLRFARYAYPPNALGLCGPDAADEILERTGAGIDDPDLRRLLRGFEGAWPYLQLIATANRVADPLDPRVVEAYWIGNELLHRVGPKAMGESLRQRFRGRAGGAWEWLAATVPAGAQPHHGFHVFGVYPWLGLLRSGHPGPEPLRVLDRCRVRWGRVLAVSAATAVVRSAPLGWDGRRLVLQGPVDETVRLRQDGWGLAGALAPGDWCALHWDWVCERLEPRQVAWLRRCTLGQLAVVSGVPVPGPRALLS